MGIGAEDILKLITNLKGSIEYWKECQPWLVTEEIIGHIAALELALETIVKGRK